MQVDHMLLLSEQVSVRKVRCAPDSLLLLVHNTVDALSWPVGSLLVGGIEWGCTDEEDEYEVPFYRELVSAEQVKTYYVVGVVSIHVDDICCCCYYVVCL